MWEIQTAGTGAIRTTTAAHTRMEQGTRSTFWGQTALLSLFDLYRTLTSDKVSELRTTLSVHVQFFSSQSTCILDFATYERNLADMFDWTRTFVSRE